MNSCDKSGQDLAAREAPVSSPCVGVCALDADDICVGCYRSGQEISNWWSMNNDQKRQVLKLAAQREEASGRLL